MGSFQSVCVCFDNILAHWKHIVKGGLLSRVGVLVSEVANFPDYTIIYLLATNDHLKFTRNVWHPANSTPSGVTRLGVTAYD